MTETAGVVVIGAGIAGISAAYELAVRRGVDGVVLVDPRPPLSLTSDKSTECYRNYWPNRSMVSIMNRSIDLLEEMAELSGNAFGLNRRGYLYVTADRAKLSHLARSAEVSSGHGSGPVREHEAGGSFRPAPDGLDLLTTGAAVADAFPFITANAVGGLFIQRAGWFSAQQLGTWMLGEVTSRGGNLIPDEVVDIEVVGDRIRSVDTKTARRISTPIVVNAAGPLSPDVARMAGVDLPIFAELHLKVGFKDHRSVVPRDAPMFIWCDPQALNWSDEERAELLRIGRDDLVAEMPIFCHGRPEGGRDSPYVLGLWEYHDDIRLPEWPVPHDPLYPEVVIRGLSTMIPELTAYLDRLPESTVDGGYYSKTRENRPLIGPAGPDGFHLMAAMSGFGVMVSPGAADLLGAHVTGGWLPEYADSFLLGRYEDPRYLAEIGRTGDSGQL